MNNIKDLIAELSSVFDNLKAGGIERKDADALANLAGKMIGASKVQLEYYALRKESPKISFLHTESNDQEG